jgi:hypothetical protein
MNLLTAAQARWLFAYEPTTGQLTWRNPPHPRLRAGDEAGYSHKKGYRRVSVQGRSYLVHRIVWLYVYGQWPSATIDHINGLRADNRLQNLRDVLHATNCENLREARQGKELPLGVTPHHGKFQARIRVKGRLQNLGHFPTPEEAHEVFVAAKRRLHEGCTL